MEKKFVCDYKFHKVQEQFFEVFYVQISEK